jgi:hypothetical protein
MGFAAGKKQEITGLQFDLPAAIRPDHAFAGKHQMKGKFTFRRRRVVDEKPAFQPAAKVETSLQMRQLDKTIKSIHETIALVIELSEYSKGRPPVR